MHVEADPVNLRFLKISGIWAPQAEFSILLTAVESLGLQASAQ